MPSTRYPIPARTARIEIRVVNSRFIATIGEARTADEAKVFVESIRRELPNATHHAFAFRAGYGSSITEGASDDGEPPGTAGRPALSVLRGADLGDVALVITRYFGGTKLGTGGLVRAYTQAAQEALATLPRAERVERRSGEISLPYSLYDPVKRVIADTGGDISTEDFGGAVTLRVVFPLDALDGFERALSALSGGRVAVRWD